MEDNWISGDKFKTPETGDKIFRVLKVYRFDVEAFDERSAAGYTIFSKSYITKIVFPKIVCYCGSLRMAIEAFKKAEYDAVLRGEIALLPCCMFVDIQREYGAESDYKQKADDLHKRKIDIADEVFILNVEGYIGNSTRSEIEYAKSIGKPVKYLNPLATPSKTS